MALCCPRGSRSCRPAAITFWYVQAFTLDHYTSGKLTECPSVVDLLACFGFTRDLVRYQMPPLSPLNLGLLTSMDSAEVIALSLKTSGIGAYLHVQAFTGSMYIASFISREAPSSHI